MRIREWQDILYDVIESGADPEGWRAVAGDRSQGVGEDLYLGHPGAGVYHLKTYAKNPFSVRGVGTRVARNLDDEIGSYLPEDDRGRFALRSAPESDETARRQAKHLEETIRAHADAPTTPDALFEDVMDAVDSPAFGPMEYDSYGRPENLDRLAEGFDEAEALLNAELDELIDADDVGRGFQ
ncbi:hypothetical protein [Halalkalicoccus jeotgali]|uniref:Uncharacterized protein n=1 Tax=Halalkalicoccus jeotgali (strain DSM 18796 / CECT 7217 / JCM 14584 / KCTC 4019 / B3) TaxID=795797 RepID=D8J3A5_HALJB|nr:hypothetical protein [Halalkalicoccus jeotgali]ADJ15212.1 hypothetical protein HacjB3_09145 [Halalkalicoccus jeotgali B3]ELY35211.1 hypothetical protein C497_13533 [Halalkalicoccus jeotgali B3]